MGVNGSGKTTTVAKTAFYLKKKGYSTILVACDTFRAAATEQLKIWGKKLDIPVIFGKENQAPSSVAFSALELAKKDNIDYILIDTAGRQHTKENLMKELEKIIKVTENLMPEKEKEKIIVLDGRTGGNAYNQVSHFNKICQLTGICITKLDGSSKGGILVL